ncbi:MAG: CerR family C-terminal domain-containing protein [Methylococcales bacterium]|nr:CerR family C-terminal domain-containing protein [Methylococcales bacterium]
MNTHPKVPVRGNATRDALICAATDCFARDGFDAVSLREIAMGAGVNQALIGYHFRNKEGLYLAVFEHIVEQISQRIDPITREVEAVLANDDDALTEAARRKRYLAAMMRLTDVMVSMTADEKMASWSLLIMREQQSPTAAFGLLYDKFMSGVLSLLTRLVQRMQNGDSQTEAGLMVMTILGQVLVFRFARTSMLRHLAWENIGDTELAFIQARIRQNITDLFLTGD